MAKPSTRRVLQPDTYWKLATLFERRAALLRQANDALTQHDAMLQTALKAAGLDPAVAYQLNDADHSATPQAPA